MATPYLEQLQEKINKLEPQRSDQILLECKDFFSGAALYANGQMCAALSPAGFFLKLPQTVRQQLLQRNWPAARANTAPALLQEEYLSLPGPVEKDDQMVKSLLELSIKLAAGAG